MTRVVAVRDQVLGFVRRHPGVHVREVERQLGLSSRLASHHLAVLESEGRVRRVEERGYTRFLDAETAEGLDARDLDLLLLARRPLAAQVLLHLLREGEANQGRIAEALGVPRPSASYHLAALAEAGAVRHRVAGRERWFALQSPDRVRDLLRRFPPVPGQLGAFDSMWADLFG